MSRVLVVDDEAGMRKLVGQILQHAGYDVIHAEHGLAAYNIIRELDGKLDLLISDIQMPHMTGAELVDRLRIEYPDLPILLMSSFADPMSPSAHDFLAKPFTATALHALVVKAISVPPCRGSDVDANPDSRPA